MIYWNNIRKKSLESHFLVSWTKVEFMISDFVETIKMNNDAMLIGLDELKDVPHVFSGFLVTFV